MNENIIKKNDEYKSKYIKYKSKYIELKKKINEGYYNNEGGGTWDALAKSALDFAKSNPNATAGIIGSVGSMASMASNIKNLPTTSSGLTDVGITAFKTYLTQLPQYQELVKSGFITPQNEAIMLELIKLEVGHLADPSFYPIMFDLIKNIMILAGSAETFNPTLVMSSMVNLYNVLNTMKTKYPKDFVLLSTFLRNNKSKIFNAIRTRGMRIPGMEAQFNIFMKLIEVNQTQQPQMIPQQQPQMMPQQQTQQMIPQQQPQMMPQQQTQQMIPQQQPQMMPQQQTQQMMPQQQQMIPQQPQTINK
jgi:hypothetical protein